ncbi:MAG: hypothetical protein HQL91_02430 [Magnetococcales bacterium]|nr:hypothetical protein [Magnetococcales bacterium]
MNVDPATARLSIAIHPPDRLRDPLAALADKASLPAGWRWLAPETLHITLRFFGGCASGSDSLSDPVPYPAHRPPSPIDVAAFRLGSLPEPDQGQGQGVMARHRRDRHPSPDHPGRKTRPSPYRTKAYRGQG